ncbi:MAG: hypothetical protein ACYDDF_12720 [Thermoplasmatota archaeon]
MPAAPPSRLDPAQPSDRLGPKRAAIGLAVAAAILDVMTLGAPWASVPIPILDTTIPVQLGSLLEQNVLPIVYLGIVLAGIGAGLMAGAAHVGPIAKPTGRAALFLSGAAMVAAIADFWSNLGGAGQVVNILPDIGSGLAGLGAFFAILAASMRWIPAGLPMSPPPSSFAAPAQRSLRTRGPQDPAINAIAPAPARAPSTTALSSARTPGTPALPCPRCGRPTRAVVRNDRPLQVCTGFPACTYAS